MRRRPASVFLLAALLPLGWAGACRAQAAPPARNANIWDGQAHEPNPAQVGSQERRDGIAPDAAQQRTLDREVEVLDRKVQSQAVGK